jgi:hypothetical protein
MKLNIKKALSIIAASAIALLGLTVTAAPASAAVPAVANIRLIDSLKDTTTDTYLTPGWYNPDGDASPAFIKYGTAGETTVLTYVATDGSGNPIANAPITLMINNAGEHATYTKSDNSALDVAPVQAKWWNGYPNEVFGGAVSGTTGVDGKVTFTIKNTNVDADAENIRTVKNVWADPTNGHTLEAGFYPTMQATTEHVDRIWYHLQQAVAIADTSVNIRLDASEKDTTTDTYLTPGWYDPDGSASPAFIKWFTAGGTINLTYTATDHSGAPIANTPIWLNINEGALNAKFTKTDGSALDAAKAGWKYVGYDTATFQNSVAGTTGVDGKVTFSFKSSDVDANAENVRTVKNDWSAPTGAELKGGFYPTLAGSNIEHVDRIWSHIVKSDSVVVPPPTNSGPAVANIRLLDSEKDTTTDAFLTPGWYDPDGAASPAFIKYGTAGETTVLTYVATDGSGNPIANAPITLMINNAGEHATYTKSDNSALDVAPVQAKWWNGYPNEVFGGAVSGTTGVDGKVTFTIKNTNVDADAENIRTVKNVWADPTNGHTLEAGFYPTMQATTEHVDRIWYHLQQAVAIADTSVNIRLLPSEKDTTLDAVDETFWWAPDGIYTPAFLKYLTVGAPISLTYVATDHNGAAIANTPIWLNINEGGTNAMFTNSDGSALSAYKTGFKYLGYDGAQFAGSLSGTTDANGHVTFIFKNADASSAAENIRSVKTAWTPPTGAELKGAFYPTLAGSNIEHIDRMWVHIVKMGAPNVTAGSASQNATFNAGKSVSFTVRNGIGEVVSGATVHFTTNSGGTVSSATGVTNSSGLVSVTASATKAGTQTITASYVDGDSQAGVITSNVVWSAPTAVVAVSVSKRNISVAVTNGKGSKQTVSITGQTAKVKTLTAWTKTTTGFKVTKAGKYTVTVKIGSKTVFSKKYTIK